MAVSWSDELKKQLHAPSNAVTAALLVVFGIALRSVSSLAGGNWKKLPLGRRIFIVFLLYLPMLVLLGQNNESMGKNQGFEQSLMWGLPWAIALFFIFVLEKPLARLLIK